MNAILHTGDNINRFLIAIFLIVIVLLVVALIQAFRQRQPEYSDSDEPSDTSLVMVTLIFSALVGTLLLALTFYLGSGGA